MNTSDALTHFPTLTGNAVVSTGELAFGPNPSGARASPACPVCRSINLESFDDLRRCPRCEHVFQWPPTVTVRYDADYVRGYDAYPCERMSWLRVGFLKAFVTRGRLLDVGYGNGAFAHAANSAGFEAWGCDVHGQDFGVREVDLRTDHSDWDVVTCFDSLEHFADFAPVRSLCARARVVVVSVPAPPPTFPVDRRWRHYKPGEHLHYFSPTSLHRLIGKPLLASSSVEDAVRHGDAGLQNIYTAVFGTATV